MFERKLYRSDMLRCALCADAPCATACGKLAVADGGHQANRLSEDRRPVLDGRKCVGCHLCVLVCPECAISSSRKRISRA